MMSLRTFWCKCRWGAGLGALLLAAPLPAADIVLEWDPPTRHMDESPVRGLDGYRIYWSYADGTYGGTLDVGNTNSVTLTDFEDGETFRFAVAARAAGRREGPLSEALIWQAPDMTPPSIFLVLAYNANVVTLLFSEPVNAALAGDPATYAINQGVTVTGATVAPDGRTVLLAVSALASEGRYTLTVHEIADLALQPNKALGLQAQFTAPPFGVNTLDTDGDLVTDWEEINIYGSDPLSADTDGDGLTDGYEAYVSLTDLLSVDSDGDGVTDYEEVVVFELDPLNADTHGRGLGDAVEVARRRATGIACSALETYDPSDSSAGVLGTRRPAFRWYHDSTTTWYQIEIQRLVNGRARRYRQMWVQPWELADGRKFWTGLDSDLPSGEYQWNVRAYSRIGRRLQYGPWAPVWGRFALNLGLPQESPRMTSLDGQAAYPLVLSSTEALEFRWTRCEGATEYQLELQTWRRNQWVPFGRPVLVDREDYANISGEVVYLRGLGLPLGQWRWRVSGRNVDGVSDWPSAPAWGYFQTAWPAPAAAPVVVAPRLGIVAETLSVPLEWERLSNATAYLVEIERIQNGRISRAMRQSVPESACTFTDSGNLVWTPARRLAGLAQYRWRLSGVNSAGVGPASEWQDFATAVVSPRNTK